MVNNVGIGQEQVQHGIDVLFEGNEGLVLVILRRNVSRRLKVSKCQEMTLTIDNKMVPLEPDSGISLFFFS
jgi:hypothetical protein